MERSSDGTWRLTATPPDSMNPEYTKVLPEYLTAFDRLFSAAKQRSEFDFVLALVTIDSTPIRIRLKQRNGPSAL